MVAGFLYSGVSTLLMAASYPIYLRSLGNEQYGLWLILATVLTFAQLSNLGLGQAVSQQVASDQARGDDLAVDACVTTALCTLLVSGGIACCMVAVFRNPITAIFHLSRGSAGLVSSLLPAVGFLSLYAVYLDTFCATLAGLGRIDLYNYLQLVGQVSSVMITLFFLKLHYGIVSFVIGNVVGYGLMHVGTTVALRRILRRSIFQPRHFSLYTLKKTLKISTYLMGGSVVRMLGAPMNQFFLARYVGVGSLPTYNIIMNGSMKMRSLLESGMRAIMPEVSRLAGHNNHASILKLHRRIFLFLAVAGGTTYAVLIAISGFAVRLWLGPLANGFSVFGLRLVLIGTFLSLLGVPAYYTLLGLGKSVNLFASNLLQFAAPAAVVLVLLALHVRLSLVAMLGLTAGGMGLMTAYLTWANAQAIRGMSVGPIGNVGHDSAEVLVG